MDLPEPLPELVDRLGEALVRALATDPAARALAAQIQSLGFDVGLMLEATIALRPRVEAPEPPEPSEPSEPSEPEASPMWSPEDRAFLKSFKIALD